MILHRSEEHAVNLRTAASVVPIALGNAPYVFDCLAQPRVVFDKFGRMPKRYACTPEASADEGFRALEHKGNVLRIHARLIAIVVAHSRTLFRF